MVNYFIINDDFNTANIFKLIVLKFYNKKRRQLPFEESIGN